MQLANFGWHNHAAAAAKDLNVFAPALAQQVHHVFEILHVAALVRADRDALRIFLQSSSDHFLDRAVVAQVNDLGPHALQNAPHDVDGRVMPIKQTGRGDKTHFVRRSVIGQGFEFCGQVGHGGLS